MDIIITEHVARTLVVKPKGRFDAFGAPAAREKLDATLNSGATNFVIDLSETVFLDSAGMAVLVSLLKRVRQVSGDVKLVWPNQEAARRILTLTRFDRVFNMVDSVDAALNAF